jgi:hypothetical protein
MGIAECVAFERPVLTNRFDALIFRPKSAQEEELERKIKCLLGTMALPIIRTLFSARESHNEDQTALRDAK